MKRDLKRKKKTLYTYEVVYGANPDKARMMMGGDVKRPVESAGINYGEVQQDLKRFEEQMMNKLQQKEERMQNAQNQTLAELQYEFKKFTESYREQQELALDAIRNIQETLKKRHKDSNAAEERSLRDSMMSSNKIQEQLSQHDEVCLHLHTSNRLVINGKIPKNVGFV